MLFRRYLRRFPVVPFIGPGSARKRPVFSDDVVDGLARIVGNRDLLRQDLQPERARADHPARARQADPGARRRAERPFLHLPVPLCRALAAALGARDEGSAAHAVRRRRLHQRRRSRLRRRRSPTSATRPRGVRAGLAQCIPTQPACRNVASSTRPARAPTPNSGPPMKTIAHPRWRRLRARRRSRPWRSRAAPPRAAARPAAARRSPTSRRSKLMEEVGGQGERDRSSGRARASATTTCS